MDFENHHFSYFFEKQKKVDLNRKVKLSISQKDFHCFELMGFANARFLPFDFSKKSLKKHTCEKTNFLEKRINTNEISTFSPPKITTRKQSFLSFVKLHKKQKKKT